MVCDWLSDIIPQCLSVIITVLIVSLSDLYVEVLTLVNVTLFRNWVITDVISYNKVTQG